MAAQADQSAFDQIGVVKLHITDPVSRRHIREYLAAADDWHPLFDDDALAAAGPYGEIVAPPLYPLALSRPVAKKDRLLADGQYSDLAHPGITGNTTLGGWDVEVKSLARVGDVVTLEERLIAIERKTGRGGPMIVTKVETRHVNQRGVELLVETKTVIYR